MTKQSAMVILYRMECHTAGVITMQQMAYVMQLSSALCHEEQGTEQQIWFYLVQLYAHGGDMATCDYFAFQ